MITTTTMQIREAINEIEAFDPDGIKEESKQFANVRATLEALQILRDLTDDLTAEVVSQVRQIPPSRVKIVTGVAPHDPSMAIRARSDRSKTKWSWDAIGHLLGGTSGPAAQMKWGRPKPETERRRKARKAEQA